MANFSRNRRRKNYQKIFLGSLIGPLQMTNDIEPHIIDPSWHKRTLNQATPNGQND